MNKIYYEKPPQGTHPPLLSPTYKSTILRAPNRPLIPAPQTLSETTGPAIHLDVGAQEFDLTAQGKGDPLGERINISGRVTDAFGRPQRRTLIEIWQANAAGRYHHEKDNHNAPLDPNFTGEGRTLTDENGIYRFVTIKPGAYPWPNHDNAWRPQHIHFSLFGPAFASRLITQMYFPGDPLLDLDPIFQSVPDAAGRERLVSTFDINLTKPNHALGYRFDIVLRGRNAIPLEDS